MGLHQMESQVGGGLENAMGDGPAQNEQGLCMMGSCRAISTGVLLSCSKPQANSKL